MPEDSTRKLLKVFGVAVTDCEDALARLRAALGAEPVPAAGALPALEAYGKAARELTARWAEVSRLVLDYHTAAEQALEANLRARP